MFWSCIKKTGSRVCKLIGPACTTLLLDPRNFESGLLFSSLNRCLKTQSSLRVPVSVLSAVLLHGVNYRCVLE